MNEWRPGVSAAPDSDAVGGPDRRSLDYADIEAGDALGQGGSSDVFEATVAGVDGPIALKEPRLQGTVTRRQVESFVEEAERWAAVDDHPNVVGVVDWSGTPVPWIALEYMDGGTLRARLDAEEGIELAEALWIGISLCRAVRYAHRHGLVHLDLKPSNVLFRETPGEQWDLPKVADWGLAAFLIDHSGSVEGLSPDYAAPEQFDADTFGEPSDFTDIYQLACVLFELFTGQPPFEGSGVGVMHSILDEDPPTPTAVDSSLPAALDPLLEHALAKRQRNRQETVVELRRGLERVFDEAVEGAAESTVTGNAPTADLGGGDTVEEESSELAGSTSVGLEWISPVIERSDVSDALAYDFERFLMDGTVGTLPAPSTAPVRLTVADGSDATMFGTVVSGRLASGTLSEDDDVIAMPGGATGSVDRIERDGDAVATANQGDRVSVSIDDVDREAISRSEVLAVSRAPCVPETVVADLFLVDDSAVVTPGYTPTVHVGTASSACTVESVDAGVDPEDGSVLDSAPDLVQPGDVARVTLRPETPTVLEPFVDVPQLGVFAVRDMGRTVALGVVREVEGTDDVPAVAGGEDATWPPDPVSVETDGVSVTKRFDDGFSVPAVRVEFVSERSESVVVELTERPPDGVSVDDIGFHPDDGAEDWTAYADSRAVYRRTLDPGECVETMFGLRVDDNDQVAAFLEELDVSIVNAEPADLDWDGASGDDEPPVDGLTDGVVVTFDDIEGTGTVACDALEEDVHFDMTDVNGPDLAVGQSVAVAVEGDGDRLQAKRLERR